jgi:hypothetical protein
MLEKLKPSLYLLRQLNKGQSVRSSFVTLELHYGGRRPLYDYSPDELYDNALHNSLFFKRRFHFEPANPKHRKQILDLQLRHHLIDQQIRQLQLSGELRRNKSGDYGLIAENWSLWHGWSLMFYAGLVMVTLVLSIAASEVSDLRQFQYQVVLICIFGAAFWCIYRMIVQPWLILKRQGCIPGRWYSADTSE